MSKPSEDVIADVLRMLARKGTYDVFLKIRDTGLMHYNDVLQYAMETRIIKSRASATTILNDLTDYGLLDRVVVQTRPTRTQYKVNEIGLRMLKHLEEIEKIVKHKQLDQC